MSHNRILYFPQNLNIWKLMHLGGINNRLQQTSSSSQMLRFTAKSWGAYMAQSVKQPTSAQVMISWFVSSSPSLGSLLAAHSLEPDSDSVSPSLSLPLPCSHSVFFCLSEMNKCKKKFFFNLKLSLMRLKRGSIQFKKAIN